MESDFQACVMAAAQVASAIAAHSTGNPDDQAQRALRVFNEVLDVALERAPEYGDEDAEEEE